MNRKGLPSKRRVANASRKGDKPGKVLDASPGASGEARDRKRRRPRKVADADTVLVTSKNVQAPRIPDHEMLRLIGCGGYGEVWLARNVMGTCRAVKVIYRKRFTEARPFEREFAGIKKFEPVSRTHPGLVNVLHIGRNEKAGYFYYIMEIGDDVVSGQAIQPEQYSARSLSSDLARRGALPLIECLQVGLSLAGALEHLHKRGLVHRDIKPSNIIFVNGVPKLADIGLVTAINDATTPVGTYGYISPEGPGTPVADLYSLGKVLYEISTGEDREHFPDLPTRFGELSAGPQFQRFNEILLRSCDGNAQRRFQSAQELRAALFQCQQMGRGREADPAVSASGQASSPSLDPIPSQTPSQKPERQRKLLTALCADIALAGKADPEAEQQFTEACSDLIRPIVQQFDGAITQSSIGAVMAVFGAPVACEDHAQRAVYAALAIHRGLESRRVDLQRIAGSDFDVKSGLNTGLTVTDGTAGGAAFSAVGEAVNLASRVSSLAQQGEILVTDATWKAVRDFFVTSPLGERAVPGKGGPLKLHRVTAPRALQTRLEAGTQRGLTPFVGRARELGQLRERFEEARQARGQILLLVGEAGVGKSRLLWEFRRSLAGIEHTWLSGRSISFGNQMAYFPITDLLGRLFQIETTDDEAARITKIDRATEGLGDEFRSATPLLKYLLSVETADESVVRMDAQQRRIRTFEALRQLILAQAQKRPLVLVIEDLHWMDKTSEDFLVWLADSLALARVLLVLSYRPGYRNPFVERSYINPVRLQHLNDDESVLLASKVLAATELPAELRHLITSKTEGNPFFVEEMIKSLLEAGALQLRNGHYECTKTLEAADVPNTIQDVIAVRIDRLAEAPRKALQLAAVIGRRFPVSLLETIADLNEPLIDSLQKLKSLELIYEQSVFPEHTCIFKHALTQEVAYNSLLLQRRKELHSLVAAAIEELYAHRLPEFYGLLAWHYERGEEWERALDFLTRAADRSHRVASYREEAPLLSQAMAIAERLGRREMVVELCARRGTAWTRVGMWAEAKADLETALRDLPPDRIEQRAELLYDLAGVCFWHTDIPAVRRCAEEGRAFAEKARLDSLVGGMMIWLAAVENSNGNLTATTDLYERALARGGGFRSTSYALYSLNLYLRGHISEAVKQGREAAQMSQNQSDYFAATFGYPHLGLALAASGRYREAMRIFDEARQFGAKYEIWNFHARAIAMSAGFHLDVFDFAGNEALAEEARERASSADFRASVVSASLDLLFNFARRGEVGRAENLVEKCAEAAAKTGGWHRWLWELRLLQARAEVALAQHDWRETLLWAERSILESRLRDRVKYEVAGLEVRAKALSALGRDREAISELRKALELSRPVGDPAMFLRVSATLLGIEGDDKLLSEARTTAQQILTELPTAEMRQRFEAAEPVRQLAVPEWKA